MELGHSTSLLAEPARAHIADHLRPLSTSPLRGEDQALHHPCGSLSLGYLGAWQAGAVVDRFVRKPGGSHCRWSCRIGKTRKGIADRRMISRALPRPEPIVKAKG